MKSNPISNPNARFTLDFIWLWATGKCTLSLSITVQNNGMYIRMLTPYTVDSTYDITSSNDLLFVLKKITVEIRFNASSPKSVASDIII